MSNNETLEITPNTDNSEATNHDTIEQISDSELKTAVENASEVPAEKSETQTTEHNLNQEILDSLFNELKSAKDNNSLVNVTITSKIKGGFKALYKELPVFLPFSQFSLVKNLNDDELNEAVGKEFQVNIYELQEEDNKRKTVIVSRKQILEGEFWSKINVGDIIEGPVSSVASFGIFIDLGGNEGLIHISRLSNNRVSDTKSFAKKGDILRAKVIEIDKEKNRIALSTRELEDSPWNGISEKIKVGDKVKAIVKRIVDYGVYVEILPKVDALLRNSELSRTLRVKSAKTLFKINQEIEVLVLSLNEDKKSMTVSYKQAIENPWANLSAKYTQESQHKGIIVDLSAQGCVVRIDNEVDGFMPRSKMRFNAQDKSKYDINKELDVVVLDLDIEKENLILKPVLEEGEEQEQRPPRKERENREPREQREPRENRQPRRERQDNRERKDEPNVNTASSSVTLGDMLNDAMRQSLLKN